MILSDKLDLLNKILNLIIDGETNIDSLIGNQNMLRIIPYSLLKAIKLLQLLLDVNSHQWQLLDNAMYIQVLLME
jgi:hypothetical protein